MEEPQEPTPAPGHLHSEIENPTNGPLLPNAVLPEDRAYLNPDRVAYANGTDAYGKFTVTNDVSSYTRARLFSQIGKETRILVRFSTMSGEKGSADTGRDPRGFSVRFYTEDGNWDLIGSNMPVSPVSDPQKLDDFGRSQQLDPHTNMKSPTMIWDYWSKHPESLHQVTMLMSDRGIPSGYRHMNGYGAQPFSLVNAHGEQFWVKFHLKSAQGIKNVTNTDATEMALVDPGFSQRDLMQAIERGDFPRWHLKIQVMPEAEVSTYKYDPFDLTKIWPHANYPLIDVGTLELNENPNAYSTHVEQTASASANPVDGIGLSPTKMLQERIGTYADEHDQYNNDPYSQPGDLYRKVMAVEERKRLIQNIVNAMNGIDGLKRDLIISRQLCHWFRCDITLGMAVAQGLSLSMDAMRQAMTSEHTQF